jgi:hypothetical protein
MTKHYWNTSSKFIKYFWHASYMFIEFAKYMPCHAMPLVFHQAPEARGVFFMIAKLQLAYI